MPDGAEGADAAGGAGGAGADIAVVFGTRPEVIKLAPVIRALGARARPIWTGQHYDFNLADAYFEGAGLEMPVERLSGVGGELRGDQIVAVLTGLMALLDRHRPRAVVVQGDTNTTNASAQAAHYLGLPVVHVEAGLRSWDRAMPEEINRMIVGVVADLHCCATEGNAAHLRQAGVLDSAIAVTGNPIVEATLATLPDRPAQERLLAEYRVADDGFVLATIHRPENVDFRAPLAQILEGLSQLPWPVVLPMHPRTAARIERFGLTHLARRLQVTPPIQHRPFLGLASRARVLVSDSWRRPGRGHDSQETPGRGAQQHRAPGGRGRGVRPHVPTRWGRRRTSPPRPPTRWPIGCERPPVPLATATRASASPPPSAP